MECVEGSNRFDGERLACAAHDRFAQSEQVPGARRFQEQAPANGAFRLGDGTQMHCPSEGAFALDDRELRRTDLLRCREMVANDLSGWLSHQPGQDSARLCVEDQGSPRSAASSSWARSGLAAGFWRG